MTIEHLMVPSWQAIVKWGNLHLVNITLLLILTFMLAFLVDAFFVRVIRRVVRAGSHESKAAELKREITLTTVFSRTSYTTIWIVAGILILSEAGVNIAPLVAAAGVVGLALGFGGQYLIKDIIAGLFILFENQYRVGDVVRIGSVSGVVEEINLRLTVVRDQDGAVHYFQNGEIKAAANLSKQFSRVNLNMSISYDADIDHVEKVINRVGQELAEDPAWKEFILEAPKFLRVDDFKDSSVVVKILGDTEPLKQWDVTGELRRRLKAAFEQEGIEIPYPQYVMHQKEK